MASILLSNGPNRNLPRTRESGLRGTHGLGAMADMHVRAPFCRPGCFSDIGAGDLFGSAAFGHELALQAADRQLAKGEKS